MSKYLYLAILLWLSFQTSTVFAQLNTTLLDHLSYPERVTDVWGYESNGREYALVGRISGVSIVDVTDPSNVSEIHFLPAAQSGWRDLKTYGQHAYVTNEEAGGLHIIDLSGLPATVSDSFWLGGMYDNELQTIFTAHDIFIDENGIGYIVGNDIGEGGALIVDLTINPESPKIVGIYNEAYIHDCFVRGDTMWAAQIYEGNFAVIDVSDKANPIVMATHTTPNAFTHNTALSDDGNYLFTTDEKNDAYVTAYDVSDLEDIQEVDRIQANPGTHAAPHNTFVFNDFLVTSYYKEGVRVVDAKYPHNLIETGYYDTSPLSGSGFLGCWGVYPYLPSGTVLATDRDEGLFVLNVDYVQAAYLEGLITDVTTGLPLQDAQIWIDGYPLANTTTDFGGNYATGLPIAGLYEVTFFEYGYEPVTLSLNFQNGELLTASIPLTPITPFTVQIQTSDAATGAVIPNAEIILDHPFIQLLLTTNASGIAEVQLFYEDNYNLLAGKWGYVTTQIAAETLTSGSILVTIPMEKGYYDDFFFDFGWTESGDATKGFWERAIPEGAAFSEGTTNPPNDAASSDFGNWCYVTGNGGGTANNVNTGITILTSPVFDLSTYTNPELSYSRWFFAQSVSNDTMFVKLNNGIETVVLEMLLEGDPFESTWRAQTFNIAEHITPTANMQLIATVSDYVVLGVTGHIVEGGIDLFKIEEGVLPPVANFETDITQGCAPLTVHYTNTSENDATTWLWNFAGGNIVVTNNENPTITYATPGVYPVTLSVSNEGGSDVITQTEYITVFAKPTIAINTATNEICEGESLILEAVTNAIEADITWAGNGLTTNIGESVTAIPAVGTHTYAVVVTDENACTASKTQDITVNETPTIELSSSATNFCEGEEVTISCTDLEGDYIWRDALGTPVSDQSSFVWSADEYNEFTCEFTNAHGCTATETITILPNEPPSLNFSASNTEVCEGEEVIFTYLGDESVVQYEVYENGILLEMTDIDGDILLPISATGNYVCIATDDNGCTTSSTISMTLTNAFDPIANFTATATEVCAGTMIELTNLSQNGEAYSWAITDPDSGTTYESTEFEPVFTFAPGLYDVWLNVEGCGTTEALTMISDFIEVYAPPTINIEVASDTVCIGESLLLEANALGGNGDFTLTWAGEFITDMTAETITISPTETGDFSYAVMATDGNGCIAIDTIDLAATVCTFIKNEGENAFQISIFPNPNKGNFTLALVSPQTTFFKISLFNTLGQQVWNRQQNISAGSFSTPINITHQPSGLYYLVVEMDGEMVVEKVMVE